MEASLLNKLTIFSEKDTYDLYHDASKEFFRDSLKTCKMFVIDKRVYDLHKELLDISDNKIILVDVSEEIKGPQTALDICEQLVERGVRRKDKIGAIGGGVIQDLATFSTSILYRGIDWVFVPTTLLAQADSCIGGKSSLNLKKWKNIIGNFYPPQQILIQAQFLETLCESDIRSGIGEIIKVHLLSGSESRKYLQKRMPTYKSNKIDLTELIINSLNLKNNILQIDPLDKGLRLKMNYGHSFGHALESATDFGIPHGIAVTIGLDVASYVSFRTGLIEDAQFSLLHEIVISNLLESDYLPFNFGNFIESLKHDKKNSESHYMVVVPVDDGEVELTPFAMDGEFEAVLKDYFATYYK